MKILFFSFFLKLRIQKYIIFLFFSFFTISLFSAPVQGKIFHLRQPDGSKVPVKIWGDENYQHIESLDGYTLVRDANGWICYADLAKDKMSLKALKNVYKGIKRVEYENAENEKKQNKLSKNFKNKKKNQKGVRLGKKAIKKIINKRKKLRQKIQNKKEKSKDSISFNLFNLSNILKKSSNAESGSNGDSEGFPVLVPRQVIGDVLGLTLLIDFPDEPATIPRMDIENLLNLHGYAENGNNGSVRDYFHDVSKGKLNYTNHVTHYYTALHNKDYYDNLNDESTNKAKELILEALNHLEQEGFDFSILTADENNYVYAINAFYAGEPESGWANGLWPHMSWMKDEFIADGVKSDRYQITNIGAAPTIGTFCHESGHMLCGWDDTYDYTYFSQGCGKYDLMSYSSPKNPVPPNPYFRMLAGWEQTIDLNAQPLNMKLFHTPNTNISYQYKNILNPREFFLIESRLKKDRNKNLPDQGLVIWHIDEDGDNTKVRNTPHFNNKVSVEQADGYYELEADIYENEYGDWGSAGDLFHAGYNDNFHDQTIPDANWWNQKPSGLIVRDISSVGNKFSFKIGKAKIKAWYKFNNNANDFSGNDYHGNLVGNPVFRAGKIGNALKLDGNNDAVEVPFIISEKFSIAFWIKTDDRGADKSNWFFGKGLVDAEVPGIKDDFGVSLLGNRIGFGIGNPDTTLKSNVKINNNKWHHVAVTRDSNSGELKIYVDNKLSATGFGRTGNKDSAAKIRIGSLLTNKNYFKGKIDDLQIYDSVLTPAEINYIYKSDTSPPYVPKNLASISGDLQVKLNWDAVNNNDLSGYNIYSSKQPGGPFEFIASSGTNNEYLHDGFKQVDSGMYYVVTAIDNLGNESNYSNETYAQPYNLPPPAPENLSIYRASEAEIRISWDDHKGQNSDIVSYNIYRKHEGETQFTLFGTNTIGYYWDYNFKLDTQIYYKVTAVDQADQESDFSNTLTVFINDIVPPAPGLGTVQSGDNCTWVKHGKVPVVDLAGYNIYRKIESDTVFEKVNINPETVPRYSYELLIDRTVIDGITYQYAVTSVDESGKESPFSSIQTVTPQTAGPAKPQTPAGTESTNKVYISWGANQEWDLDFYNLYRSENYEGPYEIIHRIQVGSFVLERYTDMNLDNNKTYYYKINAVDMHGNISEFSEILSATPYDRDGPEQPANLKTETTENSVFLDWDDNTETDFSHYVITRSSYPNNYVSYTTTESELWDYPTEKGVAYYYSVSAIDNSGNESIYGATYITAVLYHQSLNPISYIPFETYFRSSKEFPDVLQNINASYIYKDFDELVSGNCLLNEEGKYGKSAIKLSSEKNYVEIPFSLDSDFSMSVWIKTQDSAPEAKHWWQGIGLIDATSSSGSNDFGINLSGSKAVFGTGSPSINLESATTINDNNWHHLAFTYDSITGKMLLYVDNNLEAEINGTSGSKNSANYIRLGSTQINTNYASASFDDLYIFDRVITATEIQKIGF